MAPELIKIRQGKNFVICSDSAVKLEALKTSNYVNPLIKSIKDLLLELRYSHPFPNIKFLCLPAHSGIIGNDITLCLKKILLSVMYATRRLPSIIYL